jgi:hypothetical protein
MPAFFVDENAPTVAIGRLLTKRAPPSRESIPSANGMSFITVNGATDAKMNSRPAIITMRDEFSIFSFCSAANSLNAGADPSLTVVVVGAY